MSTSSTKAPSASLSVSATAAAEDEKTATLSDEAVAQGQPAKPLSYADAEVLLDSTWNAHLEQEFSRPYYKKLKAHLRAEESAGHTIYPPKEQVFRAFSLCKWNDLRVVTMGQDPYHDVGQAEGLCFSVPRGIGVPSSLRNVYKEAAADLNAPEADDSASASSSASSAVSATSKAKPSKPWVAPTHGNLEHWARNGVLLLNAVLTVQAHKANSHKKFGWMDFTNAVIKRISEEHSGVVFILWGKQAQEKEKLIDKSKHKIVKSAHPSGLSAHRGFYGSRPFSKTNKLLAEMGKEAIDWTLPPT
jgi:uracil-DNA glycosylase